MRDALSAGATLDRMAERRETSAAKSRTLVSRRTGSSADRVVKAQTGANDVNSKVSEKQANAATQQPDHQSFRHQLAHDSAKTARSQRHTNRKFLLPANRARQQQACHVGARNQQHKAHYGHDQREPSANAKVVNEKIRQCSHRSAPAALGARKILLSLLRESVDLRTRLLERDARRAWQTYTDSDSCGHWCDRPQQSA